MPSATITFSAANGLRLQAAIATASNPAPTIADVEQLLRDFLTEKVRQYESSLPIDPLDLT